MGFTMEDRLQLVRLAEASEVELAASRITGWLSPGFFHSKFWYMWATTFAFQPWHSAVEFKRYLHRFMKEFTRIETLAGVKRTIFNQYDALVRPLESWLAKQGVRFLKACTVTNLDLTDVDGKLAVTGLTYQSNGKPTVVAIDSVDLVFLQNASMTDASSLGSMTRAPEPLTKSHSGGWQLWEKLAKDQGLPLSAHSASRPIGQSVIRLDSQGIPIVPPERRGAIGERIVLRTGMSS